MKAEKPKKEPRGCVDCHYRGQSYVDVVEGRNIVCQGIKGWCAVNGSFVARKGEVCDCFLWKLETR